MKVVLGLYELYDCKVEMGNCIYKVYLARRCTLINVWKSKSIAEFQVG